MIQKMAQKPSQTTTSRARAFAYEAQDNATEAVLRDAHAASKRARRLLEQLEK